MSEKKKLPFAAADILLPRDNFEKWSVIACDQFTSEPEYWNEVENIVGSAPSTLRVMLPEIFLDHNITDEHIAKINDTMVKYIDDGYLVEHKDAMMYVEREQSDGTIRHGIVGMIDLDEYDYAQKSDCAVRATEKTVVERIPPRVRIRRNATLEFPHVLLLIDDPEETVIEPMKDKTAGMEKAYDFDLMLGGGHIKGYFAPKNEQERILASLDALWDGKGMLFAVGDGNHSLATAKECGKLSGNEKATKALVEIVNIHDPAIQFEPIYRVLFGADEEDLLVSFEKWCGVHKKEGTQSFTVVTADGERTIEVPACAKLPVGTLQSFLDEYRASHADVGIDYIHGEDSVRAICKKDGALGFIFKGMDKSELFAAVEADGSLPRKTFSMGHARDKRYYLEARKIK